MAKHGSPDEITPENPEDPPPVPGPPQGRDI